MNTRFGKTCCKVSEPTHNKQQFKEAQEQKALIAAMTEHMEQYKRDLNTQLDKDLDSNEFWTPFGYFGKHPSPPSDESNYLKRRLTDIKPLVQCCKCLKWRQLRFHPKLLKPGYFIDTWDCSMNTDSLKQSCQDSEELDKITSGELKKPLETNFNKPVSFFY